MRAIYSTRRGVFALVIRAREGGTASHCAIDLGATIVDATFWHGVRAWSRAEWLAQGHQIVVDHPLQVPDAQAALDWLGGVLASRPRYDWLRIVGYALWRTLGSRKAYTCEELLLGLLLAGGVTLSDPPKRPGVRLLREVTHARALQLGQATA